MKPTRWKKSNTGLHSSWNQYFFFLISSYPSLVRKKKKREKEKRITYTHKSIKCLILQRIQEEFHAENSYIPFVCDSSAPLLRSKASPSGFETQRSLIYRDRRTRERNPLIMIGFSRFLNIKYTCTTIYVTKFHVIWILKVDSVTYQWRVSSVSARSVTLQWRLFSDAIWRQWFPRWQFSGGNCNDCHNPWNGSGWP